MIGGTQSGTQSAGSIQSRILKLRRIVGFLRTIPANARKHAMRSLMESKAAREARLNRAFSGANGRLVFVCHGNIMRSAFAVAYLHHEFPDQAARVVGAGTFAKEGRETEATALRMAASLGVNMDAHRATPYKSRGASDSDIVICMDRANEADVLVATPQLQSNVFMIGDVANGEREVLDPYGKGDAVTLDALRTVAAHAKVWMERMLARH